MDFRITEWQRRQDRELGEEIVLGVAAAEIVILVAIYLLAGREGTVGDMSAGAIVLCATQVLVMLPFMRPLGEAVRLRHEYAVAEKREARRRHPSGSTPRRKVIHDS